MIEFFTIPFAIDSELNFFLLCVILITLLITCFKLTISKDLLESVVLMSVFSLLISISYLLMDAPDVAMTETALGACLSTCVLLNLIKIFGNKNTESPNQLRKIWAIIICGIFVGFLTFASFDLALYGEQNTEVHQHLSKYYLENAKNDIGIPSVVAAILASYRGYDTLGETSVILIAGLAVILILAKRKE
jgi:multicomponent Na+:H+ antiporter subunit B